MSSTQADSMTGLRVLVVGINYAPEHTGIAPYTTQACEHFVAQGADVLALTGVPHYPHWSVPARYRHRFRSTERSNGVTIRRLRHYVPRHQSALKRGLYEGTFAAHTALQRLPWTPDVVLAVVPSLLSAVSAALIAKRYGARFVVWVQDLMGPAAAQSGITGGSKVAALAGGAEGWVMRRADEVIVLNDAFRRYTTTAGVAGERVRIQPNWTHIDAPTRPRSEVRTELGWREDEIIVLHSGNMGLKQGLENVVNASRLADASPLPVRFVLMGDGNQRESLEQLGSGVKSLQFVPPASHDRFPDILGAADVLLVNERSSALDMSLPSKLTSYFYAGRPVIAAVHPNGGTASEVTRSNGGVLAPPEDPDALLATTARLMDDRTAYTAMARAARSYASQYLESRGALQGIADSLRNTPAPGMPISRP